MRRLRLAVGVLSAQLAVDPVAAAAPEGQLTWGVHISLAPTWFDPAETLGIITPFMVMYALHDALAKAMPGNPTAPSLAESWQVSPDGRVYEFTRSEEHTSELQSQSNLVCRLLLEKKKKKQKKIEQLAPVKKNE